MAKRVNPTTADAAPAATPAAWRDTLATTVSEAVAESMDAAPAEGSEEVLLDADPADGAEGGDEGDTSEQYASGEDDGDGEVEESGEWDGNPDTIPERFKSAFEKAVDAKSAKREAEMNKGVQKVLGQLQSDRQLLQQQMAQVQAWQQQMQAQQAPQNLGPKEPGEDASREEWTRYYDDRASWIADQRVERHMAQLRQTGVIPDPNQMASVVAQQKQIERMNYISALPGLDQDVANKMKEVAENDRNLYTLMAQSNEGAETVFKIAKAQVEYERAAKKAGASAEDTARRGANARQNAIPRLNGARQESEPDPLPKGKKYRNVREKIDDVIASQKRSAVNR